MFLEKPTHLLKSNFTYPLVFTFQFLRSEVQEGVFIKKGEKKTLVMFSKKSPITSKPNSLINRDLGV